jgi:hypothetical protein
MFDAASGRYGGRWCGVEASKNANTGPGPINYLLPGVLFAVIASKWTHYSFLGYEVVVAAFLYYFIGLVVSRVGSLIIEPLFRRTGFVKSADYRKFVAACKLDPKIELLSEANNTYRTLCSLLVSLLILKLFETLVAHWPPLDRFRVLVLVVFLFVNDHTLDGIGGRQQSKNLIPSTGSCSWTAVQRQKQTRWC